MANPLKALVFDLDGTLVDTKLDFLRMRQEMGISHDQDILKTLNAQTDPEIKSRWERVIHRHELEGVLVGRLFPGVREFMQNCRENFQHLGLQTRNSKTSTQRLIDKFNFKFNIVLSREDVREQKPAPEGLLKIAEHLKIDAEEMVYIGDHEMDMKAAKNAGCLGFQFTEKQSPSELADFHFENFDQLQEKLKSLA